MGQFNGLFEAQVGLSCRHLAGEGGAGGAAGGAGAA